MIDGIEADIYNDLRLERYLEDFKEDEESEEDLFFNYYLIEKENESTNSR